MRAIGARVAPIIVLNKANAPTLAGMVSGEYGILIQRTQEPIVPTRNDTPD